jgi:hypothetical protein
MQIIPLQAVPSQTLSVSLGTQQCTINVYQKFYGVFLDLYATNTISGPLPSLILGGQICQNLNIIVRSLYLGFIGDLAFVDTQGSSNPIYTGLGTRFLLVYLTPSEVLAAQDAYQEMAEGVAGILT